LPEPGICWLPSSPIGSTAGRFVVEVEDDDGVPPPGPEGRPPGMGAAVYGRDGGSRFLRPAWGRWSRGDGRDGDGDGDGLFGLVSQSGSGVRCSESVWAAQPTQGRVDLSAAGVDADRAGGREWNAVSSS
jgi:hypothetical protein